jgi:GT2 family glycosyltransferase
VDTVFLGAFRRRVFETVGLYDGRAFTNEDAELNQRILDAGGKVYLSRDIVVHYSPRASAAALARQYFRYGQGRARTLLKHGRFLSLRPALPFFMVVSGMLLLAIPGLRRIAHWAFAAYFLAILAEALRVAGKAGGGAILLVIFIFPLLHLAHGLGFGAGLIRFAIRPDWSPPEVLSRLP